MALSDNELQALLRGPSKMPPRAATWASS